MKLPAASALAGPSRCGLSTLNAPMRPRRVLRQQSTWASVVDSAKSLVGNGHLLPPAGKRQYEKAPSNIIERDIAGIASLAQSKSTPIIRDPLELVGKELSSLRANVSNLLGSGHPSLDSIAKYYFQAEGKHVRPLIVLLMAKATNGTSPVWPNLLDQASKQTKRLSDKTSEVEMEMGIDEPLSPREVLNDFNPHMESIEGQTCTSSRIFSSSKMNTTTTSSDTADGVSILPTQRRLAEITEMIHVASLLHDDVIDESALRRGSPSAPAAFGNKLSILGGDFLLGRASVALARLRNNEVVELLATVIANLVEGEVMQLRSQDTKGSSTNAPRKSVFSSFWTAEDPIGEELAPTSQGPSLEVFEHYLQKTYLKTAALIGKSARAATILGGCGAHAVEKGQFGAEAEKKSKIIRDAAYTYGRNLGIAFQLVDDLLDFQSTSAAFGKPSGGADLRLGLATAPVLYAWQQFPNEGLGEMIKRRFEGEGDVERALDIVRKSNGLERTKDLARHHANLAQEALYKLPESEARHALANLNQQIITRVK